MTAWFLYPNPGPPCRQFVDVAPGPAAATPKESEGMGAQGIQRRLAAILAADVAGFTRLVDRDEAGTLATLKGIWSETFNTEVAAHRGRIVKTMGDGALVEFGSVVDAVECGIAIQRAMRNRNEETDCPIHFRIGINLGDIVLDGEDIFGDGVNVASRLENQAPQDGILISDAVQAQISGKVSVSFADGGKISLKNVERPLHVWRWDCSQPRSAKPSPPILTTSFVQHSVAVLPFSTMSSDPEQEFFADGMVEDIITTLSKISGLSVIARQSSFVYKGRTVDVRQAARELGARFVLEGSVRKAGNRVRITAQLIDATTGIHIWADRYDRDVGDIFAVQDEITLTLATEMQVRLTEGDQARLRYTTTTNIEAWNLWIEGLQHWRRSFDKEHQVRAQRCWEKALALDSKSASLNGMLGFLHFVDARHSLTGDPRESAMRKSESYIARALELDPENPDAHSALAGIMLLKNRFDEAATAARKSMQCAPSHADVLMFGSFVLTSAGFAREAVGHIERATVLSPSHTANYLGVLGNAYRLAGRTEEAIAAFRQYHARAAGFGLADIIMIEEQAGHLDEARSLARQLRAARPTFTIASWFKTQFRRDAEQVSADLASLRAAGIPEE
jgi:adenylate cyclase